MLIYKPYGPSLLSKLYLIAFLAESAGGACRHTPDIPVELGN